MVACLGTEPVKWGSRGDQLIHASLTAMTGIRSEKSCGQVLSHMFTSIEINLPFVSSKLITIYHVQTSDRGSDFE